MESCLYQGDVYHERLQPVKHRFRYRLYMTYLDLAEIPALLRAGLLSQSRFSWNRFLRRDHFGSPDQPLDASVRNLVREKTGVFADGPIRLLTQLRILGYYFSPLNLFFCYASDGSAIRAVVAEVQNTPWLERHCYVLWHGNQVGTGPQAEYRHPKSFHVSPFMGMDLEYRWRLSLPAEQLQIGIDNTQGDRSVFRASLALRRVPLSFAAQATMHRSYPIMTARIMAAIYWQAFQLWRKQCPFHPHPQYYADPISPPTTSLQNVQKRSPVSAAADS